MKRSKELSLIQEDQAEKLVGDWRNCSPGELSNLFYNVNTTTGQIERIDAYAVQQDTIGKLRTLKPGLIDRIRIYMGCTDGKFSPIFTIVLKDGSEPKYDYYKLEPILNAVSGKAFPIISSGISDLFQRKWRELSNEELSTAFTGLTCRKIVEKNDVKNAR